MGLGTPAEVVGFLLRRCTAPVLSCRGQLRATRRLPSAHSSRLRPSLSLRGAGKRSSATQR
eukprot:12161756-Alexandrium_andersonii.AAC.1